MDTINLQNTSVGIMFIMTILAASIVSVISITEFGNFGIAQGQVSNNSTPSSSSLSLTSEQKAAICNPNNNPSKLKLVNCTESKICGSCKYVVFRMDDVQDYWIRSAQLDLMNVFLSKKLDLALGLIMNDMGNDSYIVDKVNEGLHKGLFQLAVHGWNHIDYTTLSEQDQKNTILKALEKMKGLFGVRSNIFIPPYDLFNNDTVKAMNDTGIRIVSTALWAENEFDGGKSVFVPDMKTQNNTRQAIYHLPETIPFDYYLDDTNKRILNSNQNILGNVTKNISTNGYAVIVIHPEDFVKIDQRGQATDVVDENRKRDLLNLIDLLLSNNIHITSFYNVVKLSSPAVSSGTAYQTMPPPSIVHVQE